MLGNGTPKVPSKVFLQRDNISNSCLCSCPGTPQLLTESEAGNAIHDVLTHRRHTGAEKKRDEPAVVGLEAL